MVDPIHFEIAFQAGPERVYRVLTDAAEFSKMSGGAFTDNNAEPGGAFSNFGGMIIGRNVELLPEKRIVQAWRAQNWEPGIYSIVRFELERKGDETLIVFDHTGFPPDRREDLNGGWTTHYWEPLRKYLGS